MKKQLNKNFILSLTIVALSLIVVLGGVEVLSHFNFDSEYGILFAIFGFGFLIWGFVFLFLVVVPAVLAILIFTFSLIARIIYKDTPGRIMAYRILMGFSFAGQIFIFLSSLSIVTSGGWGILIGIVASGYIFWAIFQGMRGTYTQRLVGSKE